MKILYLHQHFSTPQGSTGLRSYSNAQALIDNGHEVTMLCGSYESGETGLTGNFHNGVRKGVVDRISVIEIQVPYSNKVSFLKRYLVFLSFFIKGIPIVLTNNFDILFASSTPLTVGLFGLLGKWLRRKPFVFEVRDLWPELPKSMGVIKNPMAILVLSIMEWLSYKSADKIIGLAPGINKGIEKHGISKGKIHLIPNGCDLDIFNPQNTEPWLPFVPTNNITVASYCGTFGEANEVENIVKVAIKLKDRGRHDIKIVLAGDGSKREIIEQMKKDHGLDNLYICGLIDKRKNAGLLSASDVGLQVLKNVPAFYEGTSPNKFFDYISSGTPVIINYPGWISSLIERNSCGYVVPPDCYEEFANTLERVADNKKNNAKKGANALELAQTQFDRNMLNNKFVKVIELYN